MTATSAITAANPTIEMARRAAGLLDVRLPRDADPLRERREPEDAWDDVLLDEPLLEDALPDELLLEDALPDEPLLEAALSDASERLR